MNEIFGSGALTWSSMRPSEISAWHGHVAFAHWVVESLKPNVVVELGTHNGVSYFSFCNAIKKSNIDARAFAVDLWQGDPQAGFYGDSIFEGVKRFNDNNFAEFSVLLKMNFDDALGLFQDGTIDLLHIDGLHTYEAVRHDYETWKIKLSKRAVILFHDTVIHREDFGVWKLWQELTSEKPGFNFRHSAGLGMLVYGDAAPEPAKILGCIQDDSGKADVVRETFERLSRFAAATAVEEAAKLLPTPGINIALHCRATQSSFYETNAETPQGAVNGIKNGHFGFHTSYEDRPWWRLDLGSVKEFNEMRIYNRMDAFCSERSRNIEIFVSTDGLEWQKVYSHDGSTFGGIDGYPLTFNHAGVAARYVLLRLRDANFLHLDEVEIYQKQF